MSYAEQRPQLRRVNEESTALAREWRRLSRAATFVALLTSPAFYIWLHRTQGWEIPAAIAGAFIGVIAFRGLVDVLAHRLIPFPSIYGSEDELAEEDVVSRRRVWYWRKKFRRLVWAAGLFFGLAFVVFTVNRITGDAGTYGDAISDIANATGDVLAQSPGLMLTFGILFLINFGILFGPLVFLGIQQIKGYEPGDADWGVKLADVRGQAEAKEEITRIVSLWQSGEEFERAGGKRERGVLFLGAPGTGKTMLSKGIATSFNCPFVTIPGSGFAQTFIGMDAVIVRFLARKAKKLASKWGGQCIVFIDEIDAVGMRRQSLGAGTGTGALPDIGPGSIHDHLFFGEWGSLDPSGDLVLESRAWRERLFAQRAAGYAAEQTFLARIGARINNFMIPGMGGMGGGGLALNQLLVVMDGIDDPPLLKRVLTNRMNTFLDATYIIPRKIGQSSMRLAPPKPRKEEIYFIGACNVPLEMLDPALTRPGRMGRHVHFRTPTKDDRQDIFDLYLGKVAHEPDLDTARRRDELARITNGYSPAMIEQVCSMALTTAHSEGRQVFGWGDIVEAITTVESGTAINIEYIPEETRSVAIHEAGHAVASHVYMEGSESTRLTIRARGRSLGHHQAREKEERFVKWRHEEVARLVWGLGAMAAEHVFYGENGTGVAGDVAMVTADAARMVGIVGMGPERVELNGRYRNLAEEEEARAEIMERFERIGLQIMNRASTNTLLSVDPLSSILRDPVKRKAAAELIGQAYLTAYLLMKHNKDKVEQVAEVLMERREMYGDEVVELLNNAKLEKPVVDLTDDEVWPRL
jgi:ATP-dependent Zn protease